MKVKIAKKGDRFLAWLESEPNTRAFGDTIAGALGSLVGFYPSRFGIKEIEEIK